MFFTATTFCYFPGLKTESPALRDDKLKLLVVLEEVKSWTYVGLRDDNRIVHATAFVR